MKLCTAEQMRSLDQRAVHEFGTPSLLLMENAGRAVAERAVTRLDADGGKRVTVLCGSGNNGGDGFVVARHLHNRGYAVECFLAADRERSKGDAKANLELAERFGVRLSGEIPDRLSADLIIDALLGAGFTGEPRDNMARLIQLGNDSGIPILAVDLPSGLNADTGQASKIVMRAVEAVTFGLPKVGLVSAIGRELAGEITVADISLPRALLDEETGAHWITAAEAAPWWPVRGADSHKGDSGRVFIIAGSPGLTGAAALSCEAALRAGAGLVTLGSPASLNPILAAKLTEAMTLPLPETEDGTHSPESLKLILERLESAKAGAIGPGFGRDPRSGELVREVLRQSKTPLVVDADGLTLVSPADENTFSERCLITPHPGEMARLLGTTVEAVQSNRVETAREAARRFGCVVVLKGAGTVIAAPDGRVGINSSGGPALATGGTGDVLTGVVAAALARGLEPWEAAAAAVFLHGLAGEVAGERFGAPGAIAGDVIGALPEALRRLRMGEVPLPCRTI